MKNKALLLAIMLCIILGGTALALSAGDTVTLGVYPQSENGTEAPIDWRILDIQNDRALIITEKGIDAMDFSSKNPTYWENSDLRQWMNSTFINDAFTKEEQAALIPIDVKDDDESAKETITRDTFFALSTQEAEHYFASDTERICEPTPYALSKGVHYEQSDGGCWWWLRSKSDMYSLFGDVMVQVKTNGSIYIRGATAKRAGKDNIAVRPAGWILLSAFSDSSEVPSPPEETQGTEPSAEEIKSEQEANDPLIDQSGSTLKDGLNPVYVMSYGTGVLMSNGYYPDISALTDLEGIAKQSQDGVVSITAEPFIIQAYCPNDPERTESVCVGVSQIDEKITSDWTNVFGSYLTNIAGMSNDKALATISNLLADDTPLTDGRTTEAEGYDITMKLDQNSDVPFQLILAIHQNEISDDGVEQQSDNNYPEIPGIQYNVTDDGTIVISGYNGTKTDLIIPSEINGMPVTAIGEQAFENSKAVRVQLPETLVDIGDRAFFESDLARINLPKSLTYIGEGAFAKCSPEIIISGKHPHFAVLKNGLYHKDSRTLIAALKGIEEVPEGIETIGGYAFYRMEHLPVDLLPDTVTAIGEHAFYRTYFDAGLSLPINLRKIGAYAFAGATCAVARNGESVSVGFSSVYTLKKTNVSSGSKSEADKIKDEMVEKTIEALSSLGGEHHKSSDYKHYDFKSVFALPNSLGELGGHAFERFTLHEPVLSSTEIIDSRNCIVRITGSGMTDIPEYAFSEASFPNDGKIPLTSVTRIGAYAFNQVAGDVTLPDTVKEVEDYAFAGRGMAALGQVEVIGDHSFDGRSVELLPNTLTTIGSGAFETSPIQFLSLPANIISIGDKAFPADITLFIEDNAYALDWAQANGYWVERSDAEEEEEDLDWLEEARDEPTYQEALAFEDAGEYDKAIEAYNKVIDYKDSRDRISACKEARDERIYQEALAFEDAGEYVKAIEAYNKVIDYKDSRDRISACKEARDERIYQEALAFEDAGEYDKAIEVYNKVINYKGSKDHVSACEVAKVGYRSAKELIPETSMWGTSGVALQKAIRNAPAAGGNEATGSGIVEFVKIGRNNGLRVREIPFHDYSLDAYYTLGANMGSCYGLSKVTYILSGTQKRDNEALLQDYHAFVDLFKDTLGDWEKSSKNVTLWQVDGSSVKIGIAKVSNLNGSANKNLAIVISAPDIPKPAYATGTYNKSISGLTRVGAFSEGLAGVVTKRKVGYIDSEGKLLIPIDYDLGVGNGFSSFHEGYVHVIKDGKYGYIDKTGTQVIPFQYEDACNFSGGLAAVKQNGKYGFIDANGDTVLPFQWDNASSFHHGLAAVKEGGLWGFIDPQGAYVIPPQWESLYSSFALYHQFEEPLAIVNKGDRKAWYLIDQKGNVAATYDHYPTGSEKLGREYQDTGLYPISKGDNYGYADSTGNVVIPCQWSYAASGFVDGFARVGVRRENKKDAQGTILSEYGFIDVNGHEVFPCIYDDAEYSDGHFILLKDGTVTIISAGAI